MRFTFTFFTCFFIWFTCWFTWFVYTGSLGFIEQCDSNIKQYRISGELHLGSLDFVVVTTRRHLSLNGHYMSVVSKIQSLKDWF